MTLAALVLAVLTGGAPVGAVIAAEQPAEAATPSQIATYETAAGPRGSAPGATPDPTAENVAVDRFATSNPYELSVEMAQVLADTGDIGSEWVVLALGESWAEAAAAGPLAASLDAPVQLVPPGGLQTSTARPDLVEFLETTGVRRVVIVGSPELLPNHEPSVLFGLGMLPRNIERIDGDDPVGTSIAVAERIGPPAEFGKLGRTVIIASDRSVADAVAVGPLAAAGRHPLLLTTPDELDPRITAYLADKEIAHVVLVGGSAAIAPAVQEAIEISGITVTRLAGRDRSDTARLAAHLFDDHASADPKCSDGPIRVGLAPTRYPERALTAGPLLAEQCTPLRFTEPDLLPTDLRNTLYIATRSHRGARVTAFAGEAHIPDSALNPAAPPALFAFSGGWPAGHPRHGQAAVEIVDEVGHWRRYPVGTARNSDYLGDVIEWSPDGRFVAYVDAYHDDPRLVVVDTVRDEVVEAFVEGPDVKFSGWHRPVWSPDSTRLAFSAFPGDASTLASWDMGSDDGPFIYPTAEMYVFDTRTGETIRLTHNATSDEPSAWSPDGKSIAFTQAEVEIGLFSIVWYDTSLRVLELETETVTDIYDRANAHPDVNWAPDGSHVAFAGYGKPSEHYLESRVFLARSDGSSVEELTEGGNWGQIVGWTADSSAIHYSSHPPFFWGGSGTSRYSIRNIESGEDTVLMDPDSSVTEGLAHVGPDARGRSPQIRGVPDGQQLRAEVIGQVGLVVYSGAQSQHQVIIDFADQFVGNNDSCPVIWTETGIRGRCEHWREF